MHALSRLLEGALKLDFGLVLASRGRVGVRVGELGSERLLPCSVQVGEAMIQAGERAGVTVAIIQTSSWSGHRIQTPTSGLQAITVPWKRS